MINIIAQYLVLLFVVMLAFGQTKLTIYTEQDYKGFRAEIKSMSRSGVAGLARVQAV